MSDSAPSQRSASGGFALMEALVVIVCLGVLAATGITFYDGVRSARSRSARCELTSLVESGRRLARDCRLRLEVVFDPEAQACGIRRPGERAWWRSPVSHEPLSLELGRESAGGLVIEQATLAHGTSLRLDEYGVPDGPGRVEFSDPSGRHYRLTIAATGLLLWDER
ncbi:MAG: hypothetical protein AB1486_15300 [Planctomycetota bacterium]